MFYLNSVTITTPEPPDPPGRFPADRAVDVLRLPETALLSAEEAADPALNASEPARLAVL